MDIKKRFQTIFSAEPTFIIQSPGRVNLIGEHTDYNDGFVLPMAIDRAIFLALRPISQPQVSVYSLDYEEWAVIELGNLTKKTGHWSDYVQSMAWILQQNGVLLQGWEGVVQGTIPRGAGLSSSAAFQLAIGRAFVEVSGMMWEPKSMAKMAQSAENSWIGVQSGIMDQLICAMGQANHALLLDCRSLATRFVPLPLEKMSVVVLDTGTRRGLVDSAYNERRLQCERVARQLGVAALRDVSADSLVEKRSQIEAVAYRRAHHVVTENERVLQAVTALESADLIEFGRLINASHASLRDDFAVSTSALDEMVDLAQAHSACFGARMTGAGFGGCAVAFVSPAGVDQFVEEIGRSYRQKTENDGVVYRCQSADGVRVTRI